MPLEIRELVIKANVEGKKRSASGLTDPNELKKLKDRVVQECMVRLRREMADELLNR